MTIKSVAEKLDCTTEVLRRWVRPAERDAGQRSGPTTVDQQRGKELERGVVRGGRFVVTTRPNDAVVMPDLVDRQFMASRPNQLRVSDFTDVQTADGVIYTAFVIDVFARRIVGWKVSRA